MNPTGKVLVAMGLATVIAAAAFVAVGLYGHSVDIASGKKPSASLGYDILLAVLVVAGSAVAFALYFAPAIIAIRRQHHNEAGVFWVNLLVGWTTLGWILALIWAFNGRKADGSLSMLGRVARLAQMEADAALSKAEARAKERADN